MKHRTLFILTFAFSLLFTSCLADMLNEKFGYAPPIVITYESYEKGKQPSSTKHIPGKPLTQDLLPSLSEPGWDFDGWYLDDNYYTRVTEETILTKDTKLYAKWIARTDTPFTIQNYFLNPRIGLNNFVLKSEYTQYLTGTTDQTVGSDYDIKYSESYASELEDYWTIYYSSQEDNFRRIKGDGSSVFRNYYYLYRIYSYELSQMLSCMPDRYNSHFYFLEQTPSQTYDFSSIRNVIINSQVEMIELEFAALAFTEMPSYTFSNTKALVWISLPETCTRINQGAFYGCENLVCVFVCNNDSSKTWHCSDGTNLGLRPDAQSLAKLLKSKEYISVWLE